MANDDKPLGSTSEIPAVSRKPELETTLVGIEAQPLVVSIPPQQPPQQPPPPPRREPTMEDVSRQQATNAIRVISEKNPWLALVLHYIVTASAALLVVGGASLKLGWLSIGPELGGPNPKQLDVLEKRLDAHEDKLDQFLIKIGDSESGICGQIPSRRAKSRKPNPRQRYEVPKPTTLPTTLLSLR